MAKACTSSEQSAVARKKRGGVRACAGKHVFFLIFFGSFLDQAKKEQRIIGR
jgi:hypothetical protein